MSTEDIPAGEALPEEAVAEAEETSTEDVKPTKVKQAPKAPKPKKKAQKLNLQELLAMSTPTLVSSANMTDDTKAILMSLPTAPRREGEEAPAGSKSGFGPEGKQYGDRRERGGFRDREGRSERPPREYAPSKADEVQDWGAARKGQNFDNAKSSGYFSGGFGGRERRVDAAPDKFSAAEESNDWSVGKKPTQNPPEERMRYDNLASAGVSSADNWKSTKAPQPSQSSMADESMNW
eukprot:CAMPEP_0175082596 /NCGR_PEP_ID=MMETSP0052_2-20121109/26848_1 /TAXON_ID=51329 ORGANISM="Polytomella parva, Strain SAG 63-3" /NCGR_SAMPLE_ID=MMETSP0052_2 /ASSEMBLY_ACC=CAM_ASM_000194 /LENGTH=235 /DNA_ID=CAMNT_0016353819 /DNA_START=63 /DNA_END=767 /DNA_ORIENTATION=+